MMKKIILADDDFLVRSYLSQMLNWEEHGYQLVGVAQDGRQALNMAEELCPHCIILDIDMPVMNGIQLLKELKERKSTAKTIVLSCHDDFEYVKEAMKIGAEEYILKDMISPEKLIEILQEVFPDETDEGLTEQQTEKQLLKLLEGKAEHSDVLSVDAILAIRVNDYESRIAYQSTEEREQFFRTFVQICNETAKGFRTHRTLHVRGGLFALLGEFANGTGEAEQRRALQNSAVSIEFAVSRILEQTVRVGVSDTGRHSAEPAAKWADAQEAMEFGFYQRGSIFYAWECGKMGTVLPRPAEELLSRAEEIMAQRDGAMMKAAVTAALDAFEREHTRESIAADWFRHADRLMGIELRPMPKRFEELAERVQIYGSMCEEMLPKPEKYSEGVSAAIRYIQEHYKENITLSGASREVHLTTTYLSFIFHKETGITFSEYLQSCRLNHAKELLEKTNVPIREIGAMVGYNDNRHFGKMFKKAMGETPQSYRKNSRIV